MLNRTCFAFLLALTIATACHAERLFQTENIFPLIPLHSHSSSIVECPNGDLLVCWFQGHGERTGTDVIVQGARKKKANADWSSPFVMADTPEFPDCNPTLFIDKNDRVWLFWITVLAERWECSQLKYRRADDAGEEGAPHWTWQGMVQLKPGKRFGQVMKERFNELQLRNGMWAEYAKPYRRLLEEAAEDPYKRQTGWMTRIHPQTLPSGRILLPLYSDGFNTSLMAISDDEGKTWRASEPIIGLGPIQPTVIRKEDGSLVAYCRDSGDAPQRAMISRSDDEGETWSAAVDSQIPNPGSSLEVIKLADGRWLYIGNDTDDGRHRLTAMLSDDEGKTWKIRRQIEPSDEAGISFGYPSAIQSRDGLIHMTYTYATNSGKAIRHTVMNSEWIESAQRK
ncbi:MAG: sialidase family protein [Pirellulales bacterium]